MKQQKVRQPVAAVLLAISVFLSIIRITPVIRSLTGIGFGTSVLSILFLLANIFLCIVLFMKRRDIVLLAAIAFPTLLNLIYLLLYRSTFNLLSFCAYALLLVMTLCTCEQTVIKADFSGAEAVFKKIFFLPAVILALVFIIGSIQALRGFPFLQMLALRIPALLEIFIVLFLAQWLVDPYEKTPYVTAVPGTGTAAASSAETIARETAADTLKKYKDLLDIGAITQEEYEATKRQLLDQK